MFGQRLARLLELTGRSRGRTRGRCWCSAGRRRAQYIRGDDLCDAVLKTWGAAAHTPDFLSHGSAWWMFPNPRYDPGAPERVVEHLLLAARGGAAAGRAVLVHRADGGSGSGGGVGAVGSAGPARDHRVGGHREDRDRRAGGEPVQPGRTRTAAGRGPGGRARRPGGAVGGGACARPGADRGPGRRLDRRAAGAGGGAGRAAGPAERRRAGRAGAARGGAWCARVAGDRGGRAG